MPNLWDEILFGILPYVAAALFFGGAIYRGVVRPLEWSTRASGFFERPSMGIASLALHWGIIVLFVAHLFGWVGGLMGSMTMSQIFYWMGVVAGASVLYGVLAALIRRIMVPEMRAMSMAEDYILLTFLLVIVILALYQVLVGQLFGLALTVAPWLSSVFQLSPDVKLMSGLTLIIKAHITLSLLFIAYWPYTKMVHVLALPWRYFYRPYLTVRLYRRMVR
ncbi:MAG: respiratory nitrate reductase subunit gamma [Chloroflexi bacterium]|nr:respiratory nitrate reductase subunit gamma [Chloroflexota bacterium]